MESAAAALSPFNVFLALAGVIAGTVIGSLPGLTATMAVAVLVPVTFTMEPSSALIMMGAIYTGAIYGGAYSAILLNTPGTPSAIATTFDGFPMAKRGDGDLAITLACIASVAGGLTGAVFLLALSPPLAEMALAFGPAEYFWLAMFGLTLISALSKGNLLKGLIGACLGLLLACVGVAEISADIRFTFGSRTLLGGVETVSALIGLYCIPVLMNLAAKPDRHLNVTHRPRGFRLPEALRISWKGKINLIRSSLIGTLVGALPGAGGSIAGLIAYSEARRASGRARSFGAGEPEGVQATESANNATVGGGFIPTLVLGIPGTPPDAVILGALLIQGVRTGPHLFSDESSVVYTFIAGLFLATILMLPVGLVIGRYAYKTIITVPKAVLVPAIAFMTIIGAYAIRNNMSDAVIMILLGAAGWILSRFGFSPSPIVLGLILGRIAEQGFVQAWTIGAASENLAGMFFGRPISAAILVFTAAALFYPLARARFNPRGISEEKTEAQPGPRRPDWAGAVIAGLAVAGGAAAWWDTTAMSDPDSYIFPRAVIAAMIFFSAALIVSGFLRPQAAAETAGGSAVRRVLLTGVMLAGAAVMPFAGFILSSALTFAALTCIAMHEPWTRARLAVYPVSGAAVIAGFYYLFAEVLLVPLPAGILLE